MDAAVVVEDLKLKHNKLFMDKKTLLCNPAEKHTKTNAHEKPIRGINNGEIWRNQTQMYKVKHITFLRLCTTGHQKPEVHRKWDKVEAQEREPGLHWGAMDCVWQAQKLNCALTA